MHGHNNVVGATIFPHNIGLGATRDPALVQQIGRATAEEVAGTGIDWDFAPCLCVARNDRWGRTYESFGEKPELAAAMATIITGLQGTRWRPGLGARHRQALRRRRRHHRRHRPGQHPAHARPSCGRSTCRRSRPRSQRGVGSVMVSFSSWNGVKLHGNQYLITDVLKGELGFTGFVVSDWDGIDQIDGAHRLHRRRGAPPRSTPASTW